MDEEDSGFVVVLKPLEDDNYDVSGANIEATEEIEEIRALMKGPRKQMSSATIDDVTDLEMLIAAKANKKDEDNDKDKDSKGEKSSKNVADVVETSYDMAMPIMSPPSAGMTMSDLRRHNGNSILMTPTSVASPNTEITDFSIATTTDAGDYHSTQTISPVPVGIEFNRDDLVSSSTKPRKHNQHGSSMTSMMSMAISPEHLNLITTRDSLGCVDVDADLSLDFRYL